MGGSQAGAMRTVSKHGLLTVITQFNSYDPSSLKNTDWCVHVLYVCEREIVYVFVSGRVIFHFVTVCISVFVQLIYVCIDERERMRVYTHRCLCCCAFYKANFL